MNEPTLLAGVDRQIITPPKGVYLIGYGDRTKGNIGVHDDLTATALVLDDGTMRVAILSLDILTINEYVVDRIRSGFVPTEVILCCSHTHSGPIAYADEKSPRRNRQYIDSLVKSVVTAVKNAEANLSPARLEYSRGEAEVGINRREKMPDGRMEIGRNPEGPRDRSVQVVSVVTESGRCSNDKEGMRLATVVNYACHGTVLGPDNLLVSADWIGVMRKKVESEKGGLTLFLQGAAANINPDMFWEDARAFAMVAEQGMSVAQGVLAAIESGAERIRATPLKIERTEAWLPTETTATTSHPKKNYGKPLLAMAKLPGYLAIFTDLLLNQRYPWKSTIDAKDGYWSVPMRINTLQLGELVLVTYAAETFTEIGMKIKSASPAAYTLFASVSDGCISYLHTGVSHDEGGYEVDVAPLAYRYPGRLQAGCEKIALDTTTEMLERLWS
jgi:neutral ceramidase